MSILFPTRFYESHPQMRQWLARHPGLVPVLRRNAGLSERFRISVEHNQAGRATLREEPIGVPYSSARKQAETFSSPFSPSGNLGYEQPDQLRPNQPHTRHRDEAEMNLLRKLEDENYLQRHPEVRDTIVEETALRNEVLSPRVANRQALRNYLAASASRQAGTPWRPSREQLEEQPELAAWLATDRAGIAGEMAEHGEVVARDDATDTWTLLRERVGREAAGWFDRNSPLADEEFFSRYPTAALYLQENPRVLDDLQRHNDKARTFAARFERVHQRLLPALTELAAQRSESPAQFDREWFQLHQEQAVLLETGRRLLPETDLAKAFSGQPLQNDYNDTALASQWERAAGTTTLSELQLPAGWLEEQTWLPRLTNRSEEFVSSLLDLSDRFAPELVREEDLSDNSWWVLRLAQALDIELPSLRLDLQA